MSADNDNVRKISETLRQAFPHGHSGYIPLMVELVQLHSDKNYDYARGGNPLGNFQRVATILSQYPNLRSGGPAAVALMYMLKQLDAVLWGLSQPSMNKVESLVDRLRDVVVYAGLGLLIIQESEQPPTLGQPTART